MGPIPLIAESLAYSPQNRIAPADSALAAAEETDQG
jgi:hypothetical protein